MKDHSDFSEWSFLVSPPCLRFSPVQSNMEGHRIAPLSFVPMTGPNPCNVNEGCP